MKQIEQLINDTKGRIFSVTFTKKDGSERRMRARLGVTSHLKGGSLAFEPADYSLRTVFDVDKEAYRMIPLNRVREFKCGKSNWRIK